METKIKKIWSLDGILVDKNNDGVIDGISLYIDFSDEYFPPALFDFFGRIGCETTALSFGFFEKDSQRYTLSWKKGTEELLEITEEQIVIHYTTKELLNSMLSQIASQELAYMDDVIVPEVKSLEEIWTFSGFGYSEEASPYRELSVGLHVNEDINVVTGKSLCEFIARASLMSTQFVLPWRDRAKAKIKITIKEQETPSVLLVERNHISIQGESEDIPKILQTISRAKHWSEGGNFGYWEKEIKKVETKDDLLLEFSWSDVSEEVKIKNIMNNYKDEIDTANIYISKDKVQRNKIAAQFKESYDINTVEVYTSFKTAYHWIEEILIPKYQENNFDEIIISVLEDDLPNGLELNIRWIQEVYPVDLLLEREWNIDHTKVGFECKANQESTYIVYAKVEGITTEIGRLDVPVKRMDYVDEVNYAYPSSSAVNLTLKNGQHVNELIDSSRASFYQYYLKEILPAVKNKVADYEVGQGHVIPFFDRIEIDVWMNEDERKLGLDEERVSSLEALHEDLYFNTLDYFAEWGEELEGKPFYAPGGVHPFMHVTTEDSPRAEIKVFGYSNQSVPTVIADAIYFTTDFEMELVSVLKDGVRRKEKIQPYRIKKEHLHVKVAELLKNSPYPIVVPDESFKGQQIPVIECYLPTNEEFTSSLKATLYKPTIIIEAGHHSNEVSSTYAVLELIQKFTVEQLKKINIIVIPLVNIDGYQLLKDLMVEHPEWKHHAARFNAVGLEYSYVRFKTSVFGEGNILPELLRKWAPDIILDNHGIPSHEWVQPFAGYNSPPRFPVSYFLPSAKMYGICRIPQNPHKVVHEENFNSIVNVVSDEIGKTPISKMNDYWRKRFKKYGNDWLPELFLLEEAEHLNFYSNEIESDPDTFHTIGRYPDWIAADIITEAADEIVYDEVLETCIEAQKVFNMAIINQLIESKLIYKNETTKKRERPIHLIGKLAERM